MRSCEPIATKEIFSSDSPSSSSEVIGDRNVSPRSFSAHREVASAAGALLRCGFVRGDIVEGDLMTAGTNDNPEREEVQDGAVKPVSAGVVLDSITLRTAIRAGGHWASQGSVQAIPSLQKPITGFLPRFAGWREGKRSKPSRSWRGGNSGGFN